MRPTRIGTHAVEGAPVAAAAPSRRRPSRRPGTHRGLVGALSVALALTAIPVAPAAAASPQAAQAAVDRAQLAMAGKRYVEAAENMEQAFRDDPNPLWKANAGYAWMMAGQLDRAIAQLSEALGDAALHGEARSRATERLGAASSARALLNRAEQLRGRDDLLGAAEACDAALEHVPIGPFYLLAGQAYEEAGALEQAEERYQTAVGEGDLSPEQHREATEALVRVARERSAAAERKARPEPPPALPQPEPQASSGATVAGWTLFGLGLAAAGLGVAGFLLSADRESTFEDAKGPGGAVALTRSEAESLESEAQTWWTIGVVGVAVGAAAVTTGLVVLATGGGEPETRGRVQVGATPIPGGGLLSASGRF